MEVEEICSFSHLNSLMAESSVLVVRRMSGRSEDILCALRRSVCGRRGMSSSTRGLKWDFESQVEFDQCLRLTNYTNYTNCKQKYLQRNKERSKYGVRETETESEYDIEISTTGTDIIL